MKQIKLVWLSLKTTWKRAKNTIYSYVYDWQLLKSNYESWEKDMEKCLHVLMNTIDTENLHDYL